MKTILIAAIVVLLFINFPLILFGISEVCYTAQEKQYYSDSSNFITDKALVKNIIFHEEDGYIVLWLSEIDESYQVGNFVIEGKNASILLNNGFLEKVKIGDEITFISAPGYFGDGYMMPIVSISFAGETLLSFSEGYKNLMDTYFWHI